MSFHQVSYIHGHPNKRRFTCEIRILFIRVCLRLFDTPVREEKHPIYFHFAESAVKHLKKKNQEACFVHCVPFFPCSRDLGYTTVSPLNEVLEICE